MSKTYKMYLVLGDWSNDGHGKTEKILVKTNYPVDKIQDAYKEAVKKTNITFYHKENKNQIEICTQYSDNKLSVEAQEILTKFNVPFEDLIDLTDKKYGNSLGTEEFQELWFRFVKTASLPDLEYNFPDDVAPCINGYWGNLNEGFGYGLYE